MVEDLYKNPTYEKEFDQLLDLELTPLKNKNYTHAILGCTHYPLVKEKIEKILSLKALSPCPYIAQRVRELSLHGQDPGQSSIDTFLFYSSSKPEWLEKSRKTFFGPFKK